MELSDVPRRRIRFPAIFRPPEAVANIAVVTTIAPLGVAVHNECLPTVRAFQTALRLRALMNRVRVRCPPFPAACIGAEAAGAAAMRLDDCSTTAGAYIRSRKTLIGGDAAECVRSTVIADSVPADPQFSGNRSVTGAPLPQFTDAAFLICCNGHGSSLPRKARLPEMPIGGHEIVCLLYTSDAADD